MIDLGFTFEDTPWEVTMNNLHSGDKLSALRFLTLLEGEDEDVLEDAFAELNSRHILLDVAALPKTEPTGAAATRLREEMQLAADGRLSSLPKDDPLSVYLNEVEALAPITDCDELAQKAKNGDSHAMEQLMNGRLYRVVALAQQLTGYGVLLQDLMQEGCLGLCQAAADWNGENFAEYSDWRICSAMAKCITLQARSGGIGQKMRGLLEDYRNADRKLLTKLGRNPTLEEIAAELNLSPEDAAVVEKMLLNARIVAKAKEGPQQAEPEEEDQSVENTAYFQSRQRILDMLSTLSPDEAKLLTLRFGLEGGLPMNPEQAGKEMNLTSDEVIAMEAAALGKLRAQG